MGNEASSSTKPKEGGIVVVTKPTDEQKETYQSELEYCPTFKPLLTTSLNIPETRPLLSKLVRQIDSKTCLELCTCLQNHLQQCSEAVKFDQAALNTRIREVDRSSTVILQRLVDRQRTFAKHAEHSRKAEEISSTLSRLQVNLERTLQLANDINSALPRNLQLEKLQL